MLGVVVLIGVYWAVFPLRRHLLAFDPGRGVGRQAAYAMAVGVFLVLMMALGSSTSTFIYFQF
jgi:hypothetical protein